MPDRVQDLTNHRKVAVACKNYTDSEIKKSEGRILSIVARNNIDFIDHTDEATYRFTAPANAKLLMLQSIAGNSNKIAPSTPSDDSVARLKTIPDNTYKSQIDYIGGKTVKYNQLVQNGNFVDINNWISANGTRSVSNNVMTYTITSDNVTGQLYQIQPITNGHKYLLICDVNPSITTLWTIRLGSNLDGAISCSANQWTTLSRIVTANASGNLEYNIYHSSSDLVSGTTLQVRKAICIDLTDKFGAGNEPSTVETAIPLLKANGYKLDGTDTYSTGLLKHAITTSVKYDGNLVAWTKNNVGSGTLEYGRISLNAGTYTIQLFVDKGDTTACTLYIDETSIGTINVGSSLTFTITTLNNALFSGYVNGAIGSNNIKFALYKGSTAPSTYIPYVAPITKAIPNEVLADTRYGLGFDNTNYNHLDIDGHLRGSWGIVDLGTLSNWQYDSTNQRWNRPILENMKVPANNSTPANVIASKYQTYSINDMAQDFKEGIGISQSNNRIYVYTTDSANIPSGYLVYELKDSFDQDYSQYFDTNWNKVDLDNQYATCEMVADEPIDMPNKVEYYGTIIHSLATAVKQDGFNLFNKATAVSGYISDITGELRSSSTLSASDYMPVLPNQTLYAYGLDTSDNYGAYYDINKNYIQSANFHNGETSVVPSNAYYLRKTIGRTSYIDTACINISNQDLNGTYKPYKAPITRLLPNSEAKYSWGITDGVRNTRVFCDDECNPVNEGQLDVETYTFNGNETWYFNSEANREIITTSSTNLGKVGTTNGISDDNLGLNFVANNYSTDGIYIATTNVLTIFFRKYGVITDTASAKQYLVDRTVEYEKATTDTETLDDFDFSFDCEEGDTFTIIGCELLQCYATYSFLIKEAKSNE